MKFWTSLPRPIIALAPMADMTDSAYCRIAKRQGAQVVFHEMISAEAVVRDNRKTLHMADFKPEERPIVQQVFGSDPGVVAEAIRIIDEKYSPDAFDLNMGCPVYKIVCNFNGSALMKDPELACRIILAAKEATSKPVSVKTRLGWSRPDEILTFVKTVEASGADLVTIHGRTKEQGYTGQADWQAIGRARALVKIPVLVNGDIASGADARKALAATAGDGVMIGRGALGNPWVFAEIAATLNGTAYRPPTLAERAAVIMEHARLHAELQPGPEPLLTFRKHLIWYFKGLPDAKSWREEAVRVSDLDDLGVLLAELARQ
jgi:nifR3 family TIM-barrel protein